MAYGLIYNLNFSSNIGNRRHILSIYKDGHTATITTNDNNIIGDSEPVELFWDSSDDIYTNIIGSRLEINLLSDSIKQVNVADILASNNPSQFKVSYSIENSSNAMVLYWEGYLSNATFEEGISSTPKAYKLIATDLLTTLKNVYTTDGTAVVNSAETVIKYFDNVLGFLPQNYTYKVSNDFQLKAFEFVLPPDTPSNVFVKMHNLQWLSSFKNGLDFAFDNAYAYLENTLKVINSKFFYANGSFYIINNSSYADTPEFDYYTNQGVYSSTSSESVVKTIPTNLQPIGDDLSLRYDTPYDVVEVVANNSAYATQFDVNTVDTYVNNLSPYPSFETKVNGILFNDTFYSDDYSVVTDSFVKAGNYSIKTNEFITSGTPSLKILDTGFQGDFQLNPIRVDSAVVPMYFYCSVYLSIESDSVNNVTIYYSLLRETSDVSSGAVGLSRSYYNGSTWVTYTNEANATKLSKSLPGIDRGQWVDIAEPVLPTGTTKFARYRVILWQPKKDNTIGVNFHFDQVFLSRRYNIAFDKTVKTRGKIANSSRRNKKLTYEFSNYYPIGLSGTFVKNGTIEPTYLAQQNEVLTQQILNDNRTHIKRYSLTATPLNNDIIYPYHKIDIDFSNYTTLSACIIDRISYKAKSNLYSLEFHEPNQATNVDIDFDIIQ